MDKVEGFPLITITYGKSGKAVDDAHAKNVQDFVTDQGLDELLVLSHGWNNSASQAQSLYKGLMKHFRASLPEEPGLAARKIGVMAVIWPSKRFKAFENEDQAGGAASAEPTIDDPMLDAQALIDALEDDLAPQEAQSIIDAAQAAIKDASHWPAFLETLERLIPHDDAAGDEADNLLFDGIKDPQKALEQFDFIEVESEDDFQSGGAASGFFSGAAGAVGSVLNFATFYAMKRRAGMVGKRGIARSLQDIRAQNGNLRVHFVGHSFGARVVTMAANMINAKKSAAPDSMTLLQAAFSHNSFSASFPPKNKSGAFRNIIANQCVKGPILVTHTFNDVPVRVAYSIASALSGDNASFANDTPSQYGGLGANGAQHMGSEAIDGKLLKTGASGYAFATGKIYNLKADRFIKGHSDIQVPEVGFALVKAAAATLT
ncbi:MAG: hypothetical protein ABJ139_10865 [Paracoccaceae bacterium]